MQQLVNYEILVRVVDKGPDKVHTKRGDAIVVCPAGWGWSAEELSHADWRIIVAPILNTHAKSLVSQELFISVVPKFFRAWSIDISLLPDPSLFEGERAGHIHLTRQQVEVATIKRA